LSIGNNVYYIAKFVSNQAMEIVSLSRPLKQVLLGAGGRGSAWGKGIL